jgi:hypothetical protein
MVSGEAGLIVRRGRGRDLKRLFLHAGHLKTATTSAQHALAAHREQLSAHGILYPDFGAPLPHQHGALLTDWENGRPVRQQSAWMAYAEVWRRAPEHSIILSAETVTNFSRADFALLRECFAGFDIRLVFTLRHWAGFSPSRWQQYVRRGDGLSLPAMLTQLDADFDLSIDGDISLPLRRAHGILNSMTAVPYAAGDALRPLFGALEIPADLGEQIVASVRRENESMQFLPRECIRLYNVIYNAERGFRDDAQYRGSIHMSIFSAPRRMRRLLFRSQAPSAQTLRSILNEARQNAPRRTWASLFDRWTQQLNENLRTLALAPMPEHWGRDELDKEIAFTEINLNDLPTNCLKGCRAAILRQPDVQIGASEQV